MHYAVHERKLPKNKCEEENMDKDIVSVTSEGYLTSKDNKA